MTELTIKEVNKLDEERFINEFGGVYEHSPWVADQITAERPFDSAEELHGAMKSIVDEASYERKLELLRAHPDLGDQTEITDSSKEEQASAGLNQLTPDMYEAFEQLNKQYREKFGFPFIMAVKDKSPSTIREAMEARVENTESDEFQTAIEEVHTIAQLRIESRIASR